MPILTEHLRHKRYAMIDPHLHGEVLDVGCGNAAMTLPLDGVQHYVGIDFNPFVLDRQRELLPHLEFYQCDVDQEPLPIRYRQFDTILMVAIVEHLANPDWVFGQVAGLLQPEGRLVITTPTPWGERVHAVGARVGLFHPHAAEEHEQAFDRHGLESLLTAHGFAIERYQTFEFGANQLVVCRLAHERNAPDVPAGDREKCTIDAHDNESSRLNRLVMEAKLNSCTNLEM